MVNSYHKRRESWLRRSGETGKHGDDEMVASRKLSYPVETVRWNGEVISRVPEREYRGTLELFASLGIAGVMLSGYAEVEAADFDLKTETLRIGRLLRELRLRCSQM